VKVIHPAKYESGAKSGDMEVQLNSSMFINNHAPSWPDDPEGVKRFLDASIEHFLNLTLSEESSLTDTLNFPNIPDQ
jgi:hypothetical protein